MSYAAYTTYRRPPMLNRFSGLTPRMVRAVRRAEQAEMTAHEKQTAKQRRDV